MLNPTLPQKVIDRAFERDPARAQAEYGAVFRSDVEALVSPEVIEACIARGLHELPPAIRVRYFAFVDPSGGSADSMTLAIAHREGDRAVLDLVRERRPPFSPDDVTREFAEDLLRYRCRTVTGDSMVDCGRLSASRPTGSRTRFPSGPRVIFMELSFRSSMRTAVIFLNARA